MRDRRRVEAIGNSTEAFEVIVIEELKKRNCLEISRCKKALRLRLEERGRGEERSLEIFT